MPASADLLAVCARCNRLEWGVAWRLADAITDLPLPAAWHVGLRPCARHSKMPAHFCALALRRLARAAYRKTELLTGLLGRCRKQAAHAGGSCLYTLLMRAFVPEKRFFVVTLEAKDAALVE